MKQLYLVHTVFNDYNLIVRADDADKAEELARDWYYDNISSVFEPDEWIVELCDNDEVIEWKVIYEAKNIIWCEVTCSRCGRAANCCGYYTPDTIRRLKAETKGWTEDMVYRVLCPVCQKELERKWCDCRQKCKKAN